MAIVQEVCKVSDTCTAQQTQSSARKAAASGLQQHNKFKSYCLGVCAAAVSSLGWLALSAAGLACKAGSHSCVISSSTEHAQKSHKSVPCSSSDSPSRFIFRRFSSENSSTPKSLSVKTNLPFCM